MDREGVPQSKSFRYRSRNEQLCSAEPRLRHEGLAFLPVDILPIQDQDSRQIHLGA